MLVAYCVECLPQKIVLGYGHLSEIKAPHKGHPQTKKNGYFPVSYKEWNAIFVEGNDAQTKANIVAQLGARFE